MLDRLLEAGRIEIEGMSGASAGAMNTVALAPGFTAGGRGGARQALKALWEAVASQTRPDFMPEDSSEPATDGPQATPAPSF